MKSTIRNFLASNSLTRKVLLDPIRTYRLHKYYRSLLPLEELDADSRKLWLERIRKVKVSSDNDKIQTIEGAGTLRKGRLLMHNGIMIDPLSYYGAPVMRMLMENKAIHEPQEEYVFQEVLRFIPQGATMLELGCYWGFYSMWFASKVKGSRNVLIDNADGVSRARSNFEINGLKAEFLVGYIGKDNPKSDIPVTNVDQICKDKSTEFIDLLHADIQGFELEMLQTMPEMLSSMAIGYIFISTHSNDLHYSCLEFLKAKGFLILCHADLDDSFSEDGLIVARNPNYNGPDSIIISHRREEDISIS